MANEVAVQITGDDDELQQAVVDSEHAVNGLSDSLEHHGHSAEETTAHVVSLHLAYDVLKDTLEKVKEGLEHVYEFLHEALEASMEAEVTTARFNKMLEINAGAVGLSKQQLDELGEELAKFTTTGFAATRTAESMALMFSSVKGENFERMIRLANDLANATPGGNIQQSAMMLGRALESPERGMMMLRRAHIVLNEEQRTMIKTLMETGHAWEAQKMILDIVESKVGGMAKTIGETASGQWQIFKNEMHHVTVAIGNELLPILKDLEPLLRDVAEVAEAAAHAIASAFGATVRGDIEGVAKGIANIGESAESLIWIAQKVEQGFHLAWALTKEGLYGLIDAIAWGAEKVLQAFSLIFPKSERYKTALYELKEFRKGVEEEMQATADSLKESLNAPSIADAFHEKLKKLRGEGGAEKHEQSEEDKAESERAKRSAKVEAEFDDWVKKESKRAKAAADARHKEEMEDAKFREGIRKEMEKNEKVKDEKEKKDDERAEKEKEQEMGKSEGLEEYYKRISEAAGKMPEMPGVGKGHGSATELPKKNPFDFAFEKEHKDEAKQQRQASIEWFKKQSAALDNIDKHTKQLADKTPQAVFN